MINAINQSKDVAQAAEQFVRQFYEETGRSLSELEKRLAEIERAIAEEGTYVHTPDELSFGAKVAWRNNSKCIGRLFWESLEVFDERSLRTEEDIAEALFRHIRYATNDGRIRPSLTAFASRRPDGGEIRIWNHQLIRYAGYRTSEGIVGDPASLAFTEQALRLGWEGKGTKYDVLPLVVQIDGRTPKWFPIPETLVKEVPLVHPSIESFSELGLKWYAVPILSDLALEIGGIRYTAAPFNGWYMGTEIGARNLADSDRYNELPGIADKLGIDRTSNTTLWKDRALVELNASVIHSFKANGVSIVDHHSAAEQFMRFMKREEQQGREVNARWSWLIPPMSPAATPIWHESKLQEREVSPDYRAQECPY
ncbi:nitric oxide synthase oxygenase [Cohnella boryungensis]|uniref:Nitric oxide synthase oxygenase n=1 Tax=Cohnella boryungensis TaxID=768479 RepID=A0ABV8SH38_9BACL